MSQLISPWDILTSSGKYEDRIESPECVTGVRINAADLAERVSGLFGFLGVNPSITSGFRTVAANKSASGATKSAHLTGQACDFEDQSGSLARSITTAFLEQFNLYMEDPQHTKGWIHLQIRRTDSGERIFRIKV